MDNFENYVIERLDKIGEVTTKSAQLLQDIAGEHGRLTVLEAKVATQDRRNWYKSTLLGPGAVLIHIVAHKLGISV
jgi:hypothetical protein